MAGILTSHSGLRADAKRYVMAGRGVVVDKSGRGDFMTVQDAVDYYVGRGVAGRIYIRAGTYYEKVVITNVVGSKKLIIEGESWDTLIDGTGTGTFAIENYATDALFKNLSIKTTGGEGADDTALQFQNSGTYASCDNILIQGSDNNGISCASSWGFANNCDIQGTIDSSGIRLGISNWIITSCRVQSAGADGIHATNSGSNTIMVANQIANTGTDAIELNATAENCVVVANRTNGEAIDDNSGTSTVTGNNENA